VVLGQPPTRWYWDNHQHSGAGTTTNTVVLRQPPTQWCWDNHQHGGTSHDHQHGSTETTTNTVVLSLALADLVFICVCVPFTAVLYSAAQWTLGVVWCKLYQYLINVTAYASVYTLVRNSLVTQPFSTSAVSSVISLHLTKTRTTTYRLLSHSVF